LKILANTGREKVLSELKNICQANEIEAVVVGVPVSFQNSNKKTFGARKICKTSR
jgi:RNase H-fold protein (predicted Holliday junction resolvase)